MTAQLLAFQRTGFETRRALVQFVALILFITAARVVTGQVSAQDPAASSGTREARTQHEASRAPQRATASGQPTAGSDALTNLESLDIPAFIKASEARGAAMHKRVLDYTYILRKIRREQNGKGGTTKEEVKTFEAYPVRGQHLLVQLTSNGSPVPGWSERKDRQFVGKQLERAELEASKSGVAEIMPDRWVSAGLSGTARGKNIYLVIDASEFLRSCEFHAPRRERVGGRETIALDFRPRAGLALPATKAFIASLVGTIWIDSADKAVVRLEAWPAPRPDASDGEAKQADGRRAVPAIVYTQTRLSDGVWFPTLIRMNSGGDDDLFSGLRWDVLIEFSEYKQFSTGAGEVEFDSVKKRL